MTSYPSKNWLGNFNAYLSAGDTIIRYISRRERGLASIMPIPFNPLSINEINHINIDWLSNFKIKYATLAYNLQYNSGYYENGLTVQTGLQISLSGITDITDEVAESDSISIEMDSSSIIELSFDVSSLPRKL